MSNRDLTALMCVNTLNPPMQALDRALSALESGAAGAAREVEACLTEVETNLSYLNDILSTGALAALSQSDCHCACGVEHTVASYSTHGRAGRYGRAPFTSPALLAISCVAL